MLMSFPLHPHECAIACSLTRDPIVIADVIALASTPDAGATSVFIGSSRANTRTSERAVRELVYEAYDEMAMKEFNAIARDVASKFPARLDASGGVKREGVVKIALTHRLGRVRAGEASVACAVSSGHRADAIRACEEVVEMMKHRAPIWKKEVYEPVEGEEEEDAKDEGETREERATPDRDSKWMANDCAFNVDIAS